MDTSIIAAEGATHAIEKVSAFLGQVLGPATTEIAGMVHDRLALMRWERQNRLIDRYNDIVRSRKGQERCAVPPKYAVPIIESAVLEPDNTLQDMWASLLASAGDSSSAIHSSMIGILREIEAPDAKVLKLACEHAEKSIYQNRPIWKRPLDGPGLQRLAQLDGETFFFTLDNLFRMRCLVPYIETDHLPVASHDEVSSEDLIYIRMHHYDKVTVTPMGAQLVCAAMRELIIK